MYPGFRDLPERKESKGTEESKVGKAILENEDVRYAIPL